ncbi:hypothetical protein [Enterobacter sp. Ap-1006]|uniref:hypothetical protein n=1 Tax=Enterobacter sp. Ap-1006 TaxID=2608345 RepID=UPI002570E6C9|nr:hypothetical protein [Enterobacter sp. Ap-1006]
MRHQIGRFIAFSGALNSLRHHRIQATRQGFIEIAPGGARQNAAHRLRHHLVFTADAVVAKGFLVVLRITQFCSAHAGVFAIFGTHDIQRLQIAIGGHHTGHLAADFTDQLRRLQAFLLFLFVKDLPDTAVGMFGVSTQRSNVLLLILLLRYA